VTLAVVGLILAGVVPASAAAGSAAAAHSLPKAAAQHPTQHPQGPVPTVVLVHGAWADGASWSGVVQRLQDDRVDVQVFPTPLQSLSDDSAALRDFLGAIDGPVVLVGHSYGGAVITDAATGNANVKALVYVDAFAPDLGEPVLALPGPDSALADPDPTKLFRFVPTTLPPTAATELYVLPKLFVTAFANDLPGRIAKVLAVSQRPVTLGALREPSSAPAWKSIPSWYQIGTIDKVIPAAAQRAMAVRAGSHISTARTGHLPMISDPRSVTRTIEAAIDGTR
jgi:pimeloyl-ACP methyl ester carboxylesterase